MASVRPRSGGRWQVRWRQDGKEVSETFDTHAKAVRFRGLVDAAGQRYPKGWVPGYGFIEERTSAPILQAWFERSLAANVRASARTRDDYRRTFARHVPDWLARKPMDLITREDVGLWINELRAKQYRGQPISAKTVHNVHGMLSGVAKDAMNNGIIPTNPFLGALRGVDGEVQEMVFLTRPEFNLLAASVSEEHRLLIRVMFHTGMRFGEVTAFGPEHLHDHKGIYVARAWKKDGDGKYYLGPPKSRRGVRWITAPAKLLQEVYELPRHDSGLVFPGPSGQMLHGYFHRYIWQPALRRAQEAGLTKHPRPHDLRHSHAASLLSRGVPILAVSRRLGHASIKVTGDVYGHLLPEVDDQIREMLDKDED